MFFKSHQNDDGGRPDDVAETGVVPDAGGAEIPSAERPWPTGGEAVTLCFPGRNMTHKISNADELREALGTGSVGWFPLETIAGKREWVNVALAETIRFQ